jgi:hypothetical protein
MYSIELGWGSKNYSAKMGEKKVKHIFHQQEHVSFSLSLVCRTGKSGPLVCDAKSSPSVAERSNQLTLEQQQFQNGGSVSFLDRRRTSEMVAIVTGISPDQHNIYVYPRNEAIDAQL